MKRIKNYLPALMLLCTGEARALVYQWPVVTSVSVRVVTEIVAVYDVTFTPVTVVDPSVDDDIKALDYIRLKIPGAVTPVWGPYHRHNSKVAGAPPSVGTESNYEPEVIDNSVTFSEFTNRIVKKYPAWSVLHMGSSTANECVGSAAYDLAAPTNVFTTWIKGTWNGGVGVSGDCLGIPPTNEWCAMTTPTLSFNHGTLKLEDAPGDKKSSQVGVHCTAGMKYTLRLRGGGNGIMLSNGMMAVLTADGKALGSTLTGVTGSNTVPITSTLTGSAEKDGAFTGTDVLFVSYP